MSEEREIYCKESFGPQGLAFIESFNETMGFVHDTAKAHGWHDEPHEDGTFIALIHAELSEALEGLRHGNPPSEHIPEFTALEEELADVVIRCMDYAGFKNCILQKLLSKRCFSMSIALSNTETRNSDTTEGG